MPLGVSNWKTSSNVAKITSFLGAEIVYRHSNPVQIRKGDEIMQVIDKNSE